MTPEERYVAENYAYMSSPYSMTTSMWGISVSWIGLLFADSGQLRHTLSIEVGLLFLITPLLIGLLVGAVADIRLRARFAPGVRALQDQLPEDVRELVVKNKMPRRGAMLLVLPMMAMLYSHTFMERGSLRSGATGLLMSLMMVGIARNRSPYGRYWYALGAAGALVALIEIVGSMDSSIGVAMQASTLGLIVGSTWNTVEIIGLLNKTVGRSRISA